MRTKKPTPAELIETIANLQQENTVLRWFIRDLTPSSGFHVVESPRGFSVHIVEILDDGGLWVYAWSDLGSEERNQLENRLYQSCCDDVYRAGSFQDAMRDAKKIVRSWTKEAAGA